MVLVIALIGAFTGIAGLITSIVMTVVVYRKQAKNRRYSVYSVVNFFILPFALNYLLSVSQASDFPLSLVPYNRICVITGKNG